MGKKRQFIDKNKSVTFKLVGREQDDPLFVDETAPQYVLVEKRTKQTIPIDLDDDDVPKSKKLTTDARRAEQAKFGVYFDDDYDYLQHLIDAEEVPTLAGVEIQHKNTNKNVDVLEDGDEFPDLEAPGTSKQQPQQPQKPILMLPSSVFDTTIREKEPLTKRAALPVGPQLDWDPDIVEAMDDDFNFEDPENQIDDDFVTQAMQDKKKSSGKKVEEEDDSFLYDFSYKNIDPNMPKNLDEDEDDEEYDEDDDLSVCGAASGSDDEYEEARDHFTSMDEVKMKLMQKKNFKQFMGLDDIMEDDQMSHRSSASTHFTEYSMSSSVMPRNDQLKLLDEKFEQMFIREYADDGVIGALDGDEDLEVTGGIDPNQSELMAKLVDEYQQAKKVQFGLEYERNQDAADYVRMHLKKLEMQNDKLRGLNKDSSTDSSDTEYEEIEIEDPGRKGDKERLDCESVLSTYSNTNYHPKVLHDTDRYGNVLLGRKSRHIRFDPRTGMPIGTVDDKPNALTAANLARLDDQRTTRSDMSRISELSVRPKHETPEERRERKKELKEFRAQRRIEKKANRLAFSEENVRIHKTEMNNAVQKKVAVI